MCPNNVSERFALLNGDRSSVSERPVLLNGDRSRHLVKFVSLCHHRYALSMTNELTTDESPALTHADCLNHNDDCLGQVDYHPTHPTVRWRSNGTMVMFPRCEHHHELYYLSGEQQIERERRYQASLYCKHGTFVGDAYGADYLCGACESE